MKKHILLLTAVCSTFMLKAGDLTVNGHGGGSDSKFTVGISVGAALPMSAYAKKILLVITIVQKSLQAMPTLVFTLMLLQPICSLITLVLN